MENKTKLVIKGMVCSRCIKVVNRELENLGLNILSIKLGIVELTGLSEGLLEKVESVLSSYGLIVIYSKEERIVKEIKNIIEAELVKDSSDNSKNKISQILCDILPYSYEYLSQVFTSFEGIGIEKYIIGKRLEKVKELLVYTNLTLTEIAYKTGFSSVHHLSNQFKQQSGLPPSNFRSIRISKDNIIDKNEG